MNSPAPVAEVQTNLPSRATVGGSILGGIGLAPLIVWLLGQFGIDMPGEVAAIVGGLISNLVGYFFEGGRAYKEVPVQQAGFARIGMLITLAFVAALTLSACTTTPTAVVKTACEARSEYQVERCVKSVAETYEVYQQRGLELVQDPTAPEDVKSLVRKADALATPVILQMLESAKAYMKVRDDLKAGLTTEDKLLIASQNAYAYVAIAEERINAMIAALSGKPSPGISVENPVAAPASASVSVR